MERVDYFDEEGRLQAGGVPFGGLEGFLPDGYSCSNCERAGLKLWYEENTGKLFCWECVCIISFGLSSGYMDLFFPAIPAIWTNGNKRLLFHSRGICFKKERRWWKNLPDQLLPKGENSSIAA